VGARCEFGAQDDFALTRAEVGAPEEGWEQVKVKEGLAAFHLLKFRGRCQNTTLTVRCNESAVPRRCPSLSFSIVGFEVGDALGSAVVLNGVATLIVLLGAVGALNGRDALVVDAMFAGLRELIGPSIAAVGLRAMCSMSRMEASNYGQYAAERCTDAFAADGRKALPLQAATFDVVEVAVEFRPSRLVSKDSVTSAMQQVVSDPLSAFRAAFPSAETVFTTEAPSSSAPIRVTSESPTALKPTIPDRTPEPTPSGTDGAIVLTAPLDTSIAGVSGLLASIIPALVLAVAVLGL